METLQARQVDLSRLRRSLGPFATNKRTLRGLTNIFFSEIHEVDLWQVYIKRHGMKRSTSRKFVVLLYPTTMHLASIFFEQLFQPFPQKQVNMRISESSCSRFDVTSGSRPIPR